MKYLAISPFAIHSFAKGSVKNLFGMRSILLKPSASWWLRSGMMLPVLFFLVLGAQAQINVLTQHNDISRTGQNNKAEPSRRAGHGKGPSPARLIP